MAINVVELSGTLYEQINQLERVKGELYRQYFKSDFLVTLYESLEKDFPGLEIGSIDYEIGSEYDDSGGYYDTIDSITVYNAEGQSMSEDDYIFEEHDYWALQDHIRESLEDEGIEALSAFCSSIINPKYKDNFESKE